MVDSVRSALQQDYFSSPNLSSGDSPEILRVIAIGSLAVVNDHVNRMYLLGYAEMHEWSRPLPSPNPNEVMRILTKRIMGLRDTTE